MTKREIASLVIKLMGVFILLKSIGYMSMTFGTLYSMLQMGDSEPLEMILYFVMTILGVTLPIIWAVLIIKFSDKAAAWLIQEDGYIQTRSSINKDDVMMIAISCIGLYFIVAATPMLIHGLSIYPMMARRADTDYFGLTRFWDILKNENLSM